MWTSRAAEDLSVVGSLTSIAFRPLVKCSALYSRLSSGERMMSVTTLFTAGSVILRGRVDTNLKLKKIKDEVKLLLINYCKNKVLLVKMSKMYI